MAPSSQSMEPPGNPVRFTGRSPFPRSSCGSHRPRRSSRRTGAVQERWSRVCLAAWIAIRPCVAREVTNDDASRPDDCALANGDPLPDARACPNVGCLAHENVPRQHCSWCHARQSADAAVVFDYGPAVDDCVLADSRTRADVGHGPDESARSHQRLRGHDRARVHYRDRRETGCERARDKDLSDRRVTMLPLLITNPDTPDAHN